MSCNPIPTTCILNPNSPTNDITPPRVVLEQSTRPIKIVEIDSPDKLLADVFQRAPTERVSYPADDISQHDLEEEDYRYLGRCCRHIGWTNARLGIGRNCKWKQLPDQKFEWVSRDFPLHEKCSRRISWINNARYPGMNTHYDQQWRNAGKPFVRGRQYRVTDAQFEIISILKLISSLENNPAARQRLFNLLLSKAGQLIRSNPNSFGNLRGINSRSKPGLISPSSI